MSSTSPDDAHLSGLSAYPPTTQPDESTRDTEQLSEDSGQKPPPRKRRRVVISCTECHRRKQKCDRKLPCTNCVSRNKRDACQYDSLAPTAKDQGRSSTKAGERLPEYEAVESIPSKVANFGYSQTGASTLGFLKKLEGVNPEEPLSRLDPDSSHHGDHFNIRERYKSLIRQLPARTYIDKLVNIYFKEFNWQYYMLDRDIFDKQLAEWNSLSFNLLATGGPQALSPDLRAFPALLFQVLATSLLVLPSGPDPTFDSLKYAGNMTFEDLAMDYSESGVAILSLLGKRQMSVTTVLSGFLRAAFLKFVALVTEAWHAIGSSIRDAQEIGLHRDSLDPRPSGDDAESVLENQWEIQRRRKVWMILVSWDIHTGVVLGRPTTIDLAKAPPTLPVDAPIPKDRSRTPIRVRDEDAPPSPLTRSLWAHEFMAPLREVLDLEKEGPCPKDFSKVDKLHQKLLDIETRTPAYFRIENPDTRYDSNPDCHWLPCVRATLSHVMSFNFIALHRPYIFTYPKSRTEALKASLNMLHAQRLHFQMLNPQQYKTFSLFFGTFDAIVLMASLYILFPKEHPELIQSAIQHFRWAVERFEAMSERNALARAALGVLQAIYMRLKRSLGITCQAAGAMISAGSTSSSIAMSSTPASTIISPATESTTPGTGDPQSPLQPEAMTNCGSSSMNNSSLTPNSGGMFSVTTANAVGTTGSATESGFEWSPSDISWANLQPIYATTDLVYNDLVGIRDDTSVPQWVADEMSLQSDLEQPWQFNGDFGNDSVWNLLNQYSPF